jgi:hypothetical protein
VKLVEWVHTPEVLARHAIWEQMVHTGQVKIQQALLCMKWVILEATTALGVDPDAHM